MASLEAKDITKIYPGTKALDSVSVSFESGKVHALAGKNGSGKSTLLKIFAGSVMPTEGEIRIDDKPIRIKNPSQAFEKGIATVYQELSLVLGLSVAENIFLGRLPMKNKLIDWAKLYTDAQVLLQELGIQVDPKALVRSLSMGQCQLVEIAKAMSFAPKVLQLDEPTSALDVTEVSSLFKVIEGLKKKDIIIIYVSHRLEELWQICDSCTVLRDGKFIGTRQTSGLDKKEFLSMMFGEIEMPTRPDDLTFSDEVVLEVKSLTREKEFNNISFELKKGEILGIAGMLGSGRTELLKCILGITQEDGGEILLNGAPIKKRNPKIMKELGFALTPEDRKHEGLIQIQSVSKNLCLASIDRLGKSFFINKTKEKELVDSQIENLGIKVSSPEELVSSLSGGNQQKVVIGNKLNTCPKVIMLDEPSRGIDVNAKQNIFRIIWEESRKGVSCVVVSSELEELLEVCHRIVIIRDKTIYGEILPENTTVEELYSICMGGEMIEN